VLYPFQVICADSVGPLSIDGEGYQYILVLICAFLHWIELFPLRHWEIDYRKIIGICRNFDGKLLHSYFTTVSKVFFELLALLRPFQRFFGS